MATEVTVFQHMVVNLGQRVSEQSLRLLCALRVIFSSHVSLRPFNLTARSCLISTVVWQLL